MNAYSRIGVRLGMLASAALKGRAVVITVLSHDAIVRILDHVTTSGAASKVGSRRAPSPLPNKAGPALSKSLIDALNKAKKDKASLVGPLEPGVFNAPAAWGHSVGLRRGGRGRKARLRWL